MHSHYETDINGIHYHITHLEATQRDVIVLTGMSDDGELKLGQLEIHHDTESAWVELQNGKTFSVGYYEAGEADVFEAARIVEAHL